MPKDINKLTDKQRAFAEAYTDINGTVTVNGEEKQTFNHAQRSAIKAGYANTDRIYVTANRVMGLPKVQAEMDRIRIAYKSVVTKGLDWAKQQYLERYEDWKDTDKTNAKGCLDSFVRMHGGFTDNLNTGKNEPDPVSEADKAVFEESARDIKLRLSKGEVA